MSILRLEPSKLKKAPGFKVEQLEEEEGVIIQYAPCVRGRQYVIGCDFAYGLEEGDRDAFMVVDKTAEFETGRPVEVAMMIGKWGELSARPIYAAHKHYNDAFICGEAQVGLYHLRTLWDEYGVRNMYRARREKSPNRKAKDELGHPRSARDTLIWNFRKAVREDLFDIRTISVLEEMAKVAWFDRSFAATGERLPDEDLKIRLLGGGSPDLMMAGAYGWLGCQYVYQFVEEDPYHPKGTLGDILGDNETIRQEMTPGASHAVRRRQRKRIGKRRR